MQLIIIIIIHIIIIIIFFCLFPFIYYLVSTKTASMI